MVVGILLLLWLAAAQAQQPLTPSVPNLQPQSPESAAIYRRFNYFDLELLKEFSETGRNVFISPASIKATLALILEGARGKCAEEIGHALRIHNIDSTEIRRILSRLLFDLNDRTQNTHLESGNSVFVSDKFTILPDYQNKLTSRYKAQVRNVNFSDSREAAAVINLWVNNVTHGLIPEIVGEYNLYSETTIVIANALYFKGKWKTEFDVANTKTSCFFPVKDRCVTTPFMQMTETFNYNTIAELGAHAIELPYQDDKYSMLVLLPTNTNSIKVLARDMQHAQFHEIVAKLKPTEVNLEFPKFDLEFTSDLISYLFPLKIQEIFGDKANLTGIIPNENIRINNIVHKARVEINEEGTRAAAATGAVVIPLMGSTGQKLVFDRPFIFFIYHKESRNIIFEGILMEPVQSTPVYTPVPTNPVQHVPKTTIPDQQFTQARIAYGRY